MKRRIYLLFCLLAAASLSCARVAPLTEGESRLAVERAVASLDEQKQWQRLKAKVRFFWDSPQFEGRDEFRGNLAYEKPDKLRLRAHALLFGATMFDFLVRGDSFLLRIPSEGLEITEKNLAEYPHLPFSAWDYSDESRSMFLSPRQTVEDIFFAKQYPPESFSAARRTQNEVILTAALPGEIVRRLFFDESTWKMSKLEWYAATGQTISRRTKPIARCSYSDYRVVDGINFPHKLAFEDLSEGTKVTLILTELEFDSTLNERVFEP